ncbi:sugar kinase [Paenibacillus selenitireducens]|uniref:Sugar kinase n=1 Tax=Paenibacillus selenitireducens TaxID=1324314 RepID=A0A1T2XM23_9BACL|nr:ROK family transcriptional regulator [Paenibacillus selenitireducens]OPA80796.1 sugar kinase [Paenibacillus selenitireducens]
MQKHDQDYIKRKNRDTVFHLIKNHAPVSRAQLARMTGMSPTTVSRIVAELDEQGYVLESESVTSGVGRKAAWLTLNRAMVLTIGIELDKTRFRIGIMDLDGELVVLKEYERIPTETPEATVMHIQRTLDQLFDEEKIDPAKVIGVGVGIPGIIDHRSGVVILSAQLGWHHVPAAALFHEHLGYETVIDNELKARALAEHVKGRAIHSRKTALIRFGSGVGSALIIEGEIYRGENNSAGEIGHTVIDPMGTTCECGKVGCLQTYIAEGALLKEASKYSSITNLPELFEASRSGHVWAEQIVRKAMVYMGVTINNILCMYNPDSIILSGDIVEKFHEVRTFMDEGELHAMIWEPLLHSFDIHYSSLEVEGVVLGSGMLAQKKFFRVTH